MPDKRSKLDATLSAAVAAAAISVGSAHASQPKEEDPHADLVKASVFAETTGVAPGATVWVGVHFEINDGWHTYWPGQNDSGFGTKIETTAPEGFIVGDPRWPAPHRYLAPGDILDHVHDGEVTVLLPVTAPADAELGTSATFSFDLSWLVCEEVCIPGWETVTLTLPIVAAPTVATGSAAERFTIARQRIPRPLTDTERVSIEWTGQTAVVRVMDRKKLSFYPDEGGSTVIDLSTSGTASSGVLRLSFDTPEPVLSGVLEIHGSGEDPVLFAVRSVRDTED